MAPYGSLSPEFFQCFPLGQVFLPNPSWPPGTWLKLTRTLQLAVYAVGVLSAFQLAMRYLPRIKAYGVTALVALSPWVLQALQVPLPFLLAWGLTLVTLQTLEESLPKLGKPLKFWKGFNTSIVLLCLLWVHPMGWVLAALWLGYLWRLQGSWPTVKLAATLGVIWLLGWLGLHHVLGGDAFPPTTVSAPTLPAMGLVAGVKQLWFVLCDGLIHHWQWQWLPPQVEQVVTRLLPAAALQPPASWLWVMLLVFAWVALGVGTLWASETKLVGWATTLGCGVLLLVVLFPRVAAFVGGDPLFWLPLQPFLLLMAFLGIHTIGRWLKTLQLPEVPWVTPLILGVLMLHYSSFTLSALVASAHQPSAEVMAALAYLPDTTSRYEATLHWLTKQQALGKTSVEATVAVPHGLYQSVPAPQPQWMDLNTLMSAPLNTAYVMDDPQDTTHQPALHRWLTGQPSLYQVAFTDPVAGIRLWQRL